MFISNLNRDYLFNKFSQESIFEAYNVTITNNLFCSNYRKDKHPTCKLKWYGTKLLYFDNATTDFKGVDCIKFVMLIKNLTYQQALKDIYFTMNNKSLNLPSISKLDVISKTSNNTTIKLNFKDFSKEDIEYWEQFKIDINLLKQYNVHSVKEVYIKNKNGEYFNARKNNELCYCYLFNDGSCKIYFPHRKIYRFLTNSQYIQGLDQLNNPKFIVWTTSLKDLMCLKLFGIQGLAMPSENCIPKIPDNLKHLPQFYLGDADQRGLRYSLAVKKQLNIPILIFPKELYKLGCKDLSDSIKILDFETIKILIESTKNLFI